jgi:hypothetical protein
MSGKLAIEVSVNGFIDINHLYRLSITILYSDIPSPRALATGLTMSTSCSHFARRNVPQVYNFVKGKQGENASKILDHVRLRGSK